MKEVKYLTQEEVKNFFLKIKDKRDLALFYVSYRYGLRPSEPGLLKIDNLDFSRMRIKIFRKKNGVSAEYPLYKDVAKLLKNYLNQRNNDFNPYLFLSKKKTGISRQRVDSLFRKYAKKAKLSKLNPHSLRHSVAVHWLDAGRNLEEVKDLLGHKSIRSTEIYGKISNHHREEIFRATENSREIFKL